MALLERSIDRTRAQLDLPWIEAGDTEGHRARDQTNCIGCLSFAWHASELSSHHDPDLLDELRRAYLGVAKHVTDEGQFIWPNDKDMYWAGSHEHAWRLEPLLLGYVWVGDAFPQADQEVIEAAIDRAADWLIANSCDQNNNRGAVWCAVTAMCGILLNKPEGYAAADGLARQILPEIVLDDGEIGEHTEQYAGGGPCTNYTYTGLGYVYLIHLLAEDGWFEKRLHEGMRWLARFNATSGRPLATGASVRSSRPSSPIQDALPALEAYSEQDPFLGWVTSRYLDRLEAGDVGFGGHIISPWIWSAFASTASEAETRPAWFQHHLTLHNRQNVQYGLYSGRYQAGITMRSRRGPYRDVPEEGMPYRGLQAFTWQDEAPLLFHSARISSSIVSDKVNTCLMDVSDPNADVRHLGASGGHLMVEKRGHVVTAYAFLQASLVLRVDSGDRPCRVFLALGASEDDEVALEPDPGVVAFANRHGRLYFSHGDTELYRHTEEDDTRWVFDVIAPSPVYFAFSNEQFSFDEVDPSGRITVTDAMGSWAIAFGDLVTPGRELSDQIPDKVIREV